jgi:hypothetical protein
VCDLLIYDSDRQVKRTRVRYQRLLEFGNLHRLCGPGNLPPCPLHIVSQLPSFRCAVVVRCRFQYRVLVDKCLKMPKHISAVDQDLRQLRIRLTDLSQRYVRRTVRGPFRCQRSCEQVERVLKRIQQALDFGKLPRRRFGADYNPTL